MEYSRERESRKVRGLKSTKIKYVDVRKWSFCLLMLPPLEVVSKNRHHSREVDRHS